MSEIETSIVVDLIGNLDRQLKRNTAAINKFSRNGVRDLDKLDRKTRKTSKGFAKIGKGLLGIATAAKLVQSTAKVMDFDANLIQLQTSGNFTDREIAEQKRNIFEVANQTDIRLPPNALLAAQQKVIELTGDKLFARENLRNIGLAARATDTAPVDVASVISTLYTRNLRTSEEILKGLDSMVVIAEAGAVGFKDIARVGPKLLTITSGLGGQGESATNDLVALAQIARLATGSAEEATTAVTAFGLELLKNDVATKLAKGGVNLRNSDGSFRRLSELIIEINDVADRDLSKLSTLFGGEALKVFKGLNNEGATERLKRLSSIRGDGSEVLADARKNANTAKASLQSISNKSSVVFDSALSPASKTVAGSINAFQTSDAETNVKGILHAVGKVLLTFSHPFFTAKEAKRLFSSDQAESETQLQQDQAVQNSKIELEIKSDQPVVVKSITSNNLDIEVDTGMAMSSN